MEDHRQHPRVKVNVPVDLRPEGSTMPLRGATADLSLTGCYIEMRFTFPIGTKLDLHLELGRTLHLQGTVVTNTPQVGNGILFSDLEPEDQKELQSYVEAAEKAQETSS
jgi:c-di-GMP-binding flagellar brake protein YcgR